MIGHVKVGVLCCMIVKGGSVGSGLVGDCSRLPSNQKVLVEGSFQLQTEKNHHSDVLCELFFVVFFVNYK